jgi:hypothetical protein
MKRSLFLLISIASAGCLLNIDVDDDGGNSSGNDEPGTAQTSSDSASGQIVTDGSSDGAMTAGSADTVGETAGSGESSGSTGAVDSSTGANGCEPTPGAYEPCGASTCECDEGMTCVFNEPNGSLAHCTSACETASDCPASPFPDPWNVYCDLGLCWIDCAYDTMGDVCPDGYTCWDMEIAGHRATCMPEIPPG